MASICLHSTCRWRFTQTESLKMALIIQRTSTTKWACKYLRRGLALTRCCAPFTEGGHELLYLLYSLLVTVPMFHLSKYFLSKPHFTVWERHQSALCILYPLGSSKHTLITYIWLFCPRRQTYFWPKCCFFFLSKSTGEAQNKIHKKDCFAQKPERMKIKSVQTPLPPCPLLLFLSLKGWLSPGQLRVAKDFFSLIIIQKRMP